jgi:23S rRNA (uridine2552-2'-O)-methyltransferase
LTRKWLRERENDYYHRLAVEEGYRSRAAYKLLQIAKKYQLLREGDVVVDLGAFPGGWMQAARSIVGEKGLILGIDIKEIAKFQFPNVESIVDDILYIEEQKILKKLPRKADALLSDTSPNISRIWEVDHARQIELAETSLRIATMILRPGGNLLVKTFQGDLLKNFANEVGKSFSQVRFVKPSASRKKSSEIYVLGLDFKP